MTPNRRCSRRVCPVVELYGDSLHLRGFECLGASESTLRAIRSGGDELVGNSSRYFHCAKSTTGDDGSWWSAVQERATVIFDGG